MTSLACVKVDNSISGTMFLAFSFTFVLFVNTTKNNNNDDTKHCTSQSTHHRLSEWERLPCFPTPGTYIGRVLCDCCLSFMLIAHIACLSSLFHRVGCCCRWSVADIDQTVEYTKYNRVKTFWNENKISISTK